MGTAAGALPGAGLHLKEVGRARRQWAGMTPRSMELGPDLFRTQKWEATRANYPRLLRRTMVGSAAGFATGALTGALIDYIRRRRRE